MPFSQPFIFRESQGDEPDSGVDPMREFTNQLNFVISDIYSKLDFALGVGGQTFTPVSFSVSLGGGWPAPIDLTIAGGAVTIPSTSSGRIWANIDTESGAASDALTTINGGVEGDDLMIQAKNSSRDVVVTPGTSLRFRKAFTLRSVRSKMNFVCISAGVWDLRYRSRNA